MIHLSNVSRHFRRGPDVIKALDRVTLEIQAGRFVALMGPSGSGKSTLLNILSGIDRADEGEVEVAGQRLTGLSEDELAVWRARHVGLVFQFYNLMPVLSACENVELPLLLTDLSRPERRRRAELALEVVGLMRERFEHLPGALSGGEQQRVAIARAIVTDPDLIVADEPTGDLDARSADQVLALLSELNREFEKTIVLVTHDPRALRWVQAIYHLDKGSLLEGVEATRATQAVEQTLGVPPRSAAR
ncbi:MAG: ABC transporter ATP-binding protein [Deltaproteobacteria bacterium]|nr:ABC transporter ATP-binding protein [Deltaproteobacteria bacterium]